MFKVTPNRLLLTIGWGKRYIIYLRPEDNALYRYTQTDNTLFWFFLIPINITTIWPLPFQIVVSQRLTLFCLA